MMRSRLVVLAAAIAAAALTARLGVWQLDRAAQKNAVQASLDERRGLPALGVGELARDAATAVAQHHRAISLTGTWLGGSTRFLDNRAMGGRAGFVVVTPLLLADGDAVVVQRGWVARDPLDRARVPQIPTPAGTVRVVGRLAPPPSRLYELGPEASGPIRQNLDLESYRREVGVRLRPLSVLQERDATEPDDGLVRQWPAPAADVHKHYGYAFQWFALSGLIIGLYVWFQFIRPRRRRA